MESKKAIAAFAALAQETRLKIFRLLVRRGPEGMPAGKIAEKLDIPANTLSFHLALLSQAGLIESRRAGRTIHYKMSQRGIRDLTSFLVKDCCRDSPEICDPAPQQEACCEAPRKANARAIRASGDRSISKPPQRKA